MRLHRSIPLLRIVPDDTKFDFMRFRRISFPVSALLSIVAILLYFFHGLNFGIDFIGGTLIEVQAKAGPADLAKMRTTLGGLGLGEVQLQQFGAPTDVLIRVAQQPGGEEAQQAAVTKVRQRARRRGRTTAASRWSARASRPSCWPTARSGSMLAIFAILIYLWFRFEWQFALGAMVANVHDLVLTIGFMSLTQIDFDLTSIAALLTILGYSLNDTVVIYDRIREMLRRYKRMPMPDLLNISVNSTLSRSIITHVTVTLALLALLAVRRPRDPQLRRHHDVRRGAGRHLYVGVHRGADPDLSRRRHRRATRGAEPRRARRRADAPRRDAAGRLTAPHLPRRRADRRLWQGRLPLRRHVASRLAAVPAERDLGLAGDAGADEIDEAALAPVFAAAAEIGLFLIGTGREPWMHAGRAAAALPRAQAQCRGDRARARRSRPTTSCSAKAAASPRA